MAMAVAMAAGSLGVRIRCARATGTALFSSSCPVNTDAVAEMNDELASVFGVAPAATAAEGLGGVFGGASGASSPEGEMFCRPSGEEIRMQGASSSSSGHGAGVLTHVDAATGSARMVDVGEKAATRRVAVAECTVRLGTAAMAAVRGNAMAKGDVLGVARIGGINAAKYTSMVIPLCHPVALDAVHVHLRLDDAEGCIRVEAEASCTGRTGVEMEAMSAAAGAGLTVYDMCKAVDKGIRITDLRLTYKEGGRSGVFGEARRHARQGIDDE